MPRIWVDADACPQVIKAILYRAAERTRVVVTLVANNPGRVPESLVIKTIRVPKGTDGADDRIMELMETGDLVVTADIPLAARVIEAEGTALNPRGQLYTADNISERLAIRDLATELREDGVRTGGPPPLDNTARQRFANELDRYLARISR